MPEVLVHSVRGAPFGCAGLTVARAPARSGQPVDNPNSTLSGT